MIKECEKRMSTRFNIDQGQIPSKELKKLQEQLYE